MNDDIQDDGTLEGTEENQLETTGEVVNESDDDGGYQFEDASEIKSETESKPAHTTHETSSGGRYANEVFSKTIHAKFRTFYIDLKESHNGKFLKISEKSRGRKSTIMMDCEDIPEMIQALQEVQQKI